MYEAKRATRFKRCEMFVGRNVPLDLRGAKCVRGETWDIRANIHV